MWITIIVLGIIAVIGLLLMNSKEEGEQAVGAYTLGALLPALIKVVTVVGVILAFIRACS